MKLGLLPTTLPDVSHPAVSNTWFSSAPEIPSRVDQKVSNVESSSLFHDDQKHAVSQLLSFDEASANWRKRKLRESNDKKLPTKKKLKTSYNEKRLKLKLCSEPFREVSNPLPHQDELGYFYDITLDRTFAIWQSDQTRPTSNLLLRYFLLDMASFDANLVSKLCTATQAEFYAQFRIFFPSFACDGFENDHMFDRLESVLVLISNTMLNWYRSQLAYLTDSNSNPNLDIKQNQNQFHRAYSRFWKQTHTHLTKFKCRARFIQHAPMSHPLLDFLPVIHAHPTLHHFHIQLCKELTRLSMNVPVYHFPII